MHSFYNVYKSHYLKATELFLLCPEFQGSIIPTNQVSVFDLMKPEEKT